MDKTNTIRVIISAATNFDWPLFQMDVKNAFLQRELEEEIFMEPPEGHLFIKLGQVCKLKKAIYGLKQSPRACYYKISKVLLHFGFKKSYVDDTLFTFDNEKWKNYPMYMLMALTLLGITRRILII